MKAMDRLVERGRLARGRCPDEPGSGVALHRRHRGRACSEEATASARGRTSRKSRDGAPRTYERAGHAAARRYVFWVLGLAGPEDEGEGRRVAHVYIIN